MRRPARHGRPLLLGLTLVASGCKVNDAFYRSAIYTCDSRSTDPNQCGAGYSCFPTRQVGGQDFCVPTCKTSGAIGADSWCVDGQYQIAACNAQRYPSSDCPDGPRCGCPSGLECIRDAVEGAGGLCLPALACEVSGDCTDPARATCASGAFAGHYPLAFSAAPGSRSACDGSLCPGGGSVPYPDRMVCVTGGCSTGVASCAPGEICLRAVYEALIASSGGQSADAGAADGGLSPTDAGASVTLGLPLATGVPDVCVPHCSGRSHACPPGWVCSDVIGLPAAGGLVYCMPGFIGDNCQDDTQCLAQGSGSCQMLGPTSRRVCAVECPNGDKDCSRWDNPGIMAVEHFRCVSNGACLSSASFFNGLCASDADCTDPGTACFRARANGPGVCLPSCPTPGVDCAGAYPSLCAPTAELSPTGSVSVANVCVPSMAGGPCRTDDKNAGFCPPGESCVSVDTTRPVVGECLSAPCTSDAQCSDHWYVGFDDAGRALPGVCGHPHSATTANCGLANGATCTLPSQCAAGRCVDGHCGSPRGARCVLNYECRSGTCLLGTCT